MNQALQLLTVPFFACPLLTGIHAYLGLHVIERGVIFVDLALAQIAALGVTFAFLAGYGLQSTAAYFTSLAFTFLGAAIFSLSRMKGGRIPQEAIIGIVYAVSAGAAVLAVDRAPHGAEHIKYILVGSILTVSAQETFTLLLLYGGIGLFHWVFRHRFLLISLDPQEADRQGLWIRFWDFLFYISFGFVVTSSVQIAGVLLVFSYLIVPAVCGSFFSVRVGPLLAIGWVWGFAASVVGLSGSYVWDLPTGATVVCTFGLILILRALARILPPHLTRIRAGEGHRYLWGTVMGGSVLLLLAALYLMIHPRGSHLWLHLSAFHRLDPEGRGGAQAPSRHAPKGHMGGDGDFRRDEGPSLADPGRSHGDRLGGSDGPRDVKGEGEGPAGLYSGGSRCRGWG